LEAAVARSTKIYEYDIDVSLSYESILDRMQGPKPQLAISELAKKVVERYELNPINHVVLVALLVNAKVLNANSASTFLQISRGNDGQYPDVIREVLDIAWLTCEDEKDNIMLPDADDSLGMALTDVVEQVLIRS